MMEDRRPGRTRLAGLMALSLATTMASPAEASLDVVFVLDVTGSMSGELREAKTRVGELAAALREARGQSLRFGVVAFRDRKDSFLTKTSPLSGDIEVTERFLAGLAAGGGGDSPEDVLAALSVAIRDMDWSPEAERRVFLVGDAPPHLDYPDGPRPETLIAEARAERIVVDALGCRSLSSAGKAFFRNFAYATEGRYQHIGHVDLETGGMTASMLDSLASPPPLPETRLALKRVSSEAGELLEARWRERGCRFELALPAGVRLVQTPVVLADDERVVVQARVAATGDPGGLFELSPCVSSDAQLELRLGGAR